MYGEFPPEICKSMLPLAGLSQSVAFVTTAEIEISSGSIIVKSL